MKPFVLLYLLISATVQLHAQPNIVFRDAPQQVMELGRGTAVTLDWHPAGNVLAVGGRRGLWLYDDSLVDLAHFDEIGELVELAWSPDGDMLATFGRDGFLRVWMVTLDPYTLMFHRLWVFGSADEYSMLYVEWSPNGEKLAVITENGAQVLDVMTGEELINVPDLDYVVRWHPNSSQIAGVVDLGEELGKQVRVWDVTASAVVHTYMGSESYLFWSDIQWSPDGSVLVGITSIPATLHAWSVETGDLLNDVDVVAGEFGAYLHMWWLDARQQLVTISRYVSPPGNMVLNIWDTENWTPRDQGFLLGDVRDIAKRPNANEWALLTWGGQLMTWGLQETEPLRIRSVYSQPAHLLVWSPDSHNLAVAGYSGETISIWDVTTLAQPHSQIAVIPYQSWNVDELRWSTNGATLMGFLSIPQITAPGAFPTAFIIEWDAETGEFISTIHETPGYVSHDGSGNYLPNYVWSNDFTRVVTEMSDQPLTISTTGGEYGLFSPDRNIAAIDFEDNPSEIIWSPDNAMLAVITRDPERETSAWVYDAATGSLINRLRPSFLTVLYDISWSPDSSMVALVGRRGIAGSGETEYRLDILEIDPSSDKAAHITTITDVDTAIYHAWHPDSHFIAVTTSSGVAIYPMEAESIGVDTTPIVTIPDIRVGALMWSPNGMWLAGGDEDGTVRVWDVRDINR